MDREIGRLEDDRKRGFVHELGAVEERGERVVLGRQLLAPKEEQRDVAGGGAGASVANELDGDRKSALHVARTDPVYGAALDAPREVVLRRDRVIVRRQHDQRQSGSARRREEERFVAGELGLPTVRNELEEAFADRFLRAALGRDVHEFERPRGKTVGERGHWRSVPRHNLAVTARQPDPAPGAEPERAFLVGVYPKGSDGASELDELRELARTSGAVPVGEIAQHRGRPDPRTFLGKGKLADLKEAYGTAASEVLLADDELSPTQQRALEDALGARVVDRTQLILDIFAQHARSSEGKLQVELAQLEYNLPRMRGMWQHLERLGGGVGTRGPGESQLETDRRIARRRITLLRRRLGDLSKQREVRRKERRRTGAPTVALAGYTNVGKSTLLNALTDAEVAVNDMLFETLDPTTRAFEYEGRRYLVTDTVGFIRRLPTELVEGFAATLEETLVADLVLHVVDGSASEERMHEQEAAVRAVLREIGAGDLPLEVVVNKVDAVDALSRRRLANTHPHAVQVSALTGEGLDELRARIAERFADRFEAVTLFLPYGEGGKLAELYELGAPIEEREDQPDGVYVRARLPGRELRRFAGYLVAEARAERARRAR